MKSPDIFAILLLMVFMFSVCSPPIKRSATKIEFYNDGVKVQNLHTLSLSFFLDDTLKAINGITLEDSIYISSLSEFKNQNINVTLKFNDDVFLFTNIPTTELENNPATWVFGIDNKPFSDSLGLLSPNEKADSSKNNYRRLIYFMIDPYEKSIGRRFIIKEK